MLRSRAMLSLLALLLLSNILPAQWVQTGPNGGEVAALLTTGSVSYAVTRYSGIYQLAGESWSRGGGELSSSYLTSIAASSRLYVGSSDGVFISSDAGTSWQHVRGTAFGGHRILCLAADDSLVMAGTDAGAYRSLDYGTTWQIAGAGLPFRDVNALATDSRGTYAGLSNAGVYYSSDRGNSWSLRSNGLMNTTVTALMVEDTVLYAGTDYGLHKSTDKGDHWVYAGGVTRGVTCLFDDSTGLYVGTTGNGIFRRLPGTSIWTPVNQGLFSMKITGIARSGQQLLVSSGDGVFSSSTGDSWVDFNHGLYANIVLAIGKVGCTILAGVLGTGIFVSHDCGSSWTRSTIPSQGSSGGTFLKVGSVWYAGTGVGALQSTDEGSTWLQPPGSFTQSVHNLAASSTFLFAAGRGLFRHVIGSSSWDSLPLGSSSTRALIALDSIVLVAARDPATLGLHRSTDYGMHWTTCNTGLADINVASLATSPSTVYAGTGYAGAFKSQNKGLTWSACNPDLAGGYYVLELATSGENVFAAVAQTGLFLSQDRGDSWQHLDPPILTWDIRSLECYEETLFVGTHSRGLWSRPINELVSGVVLEPQLAGC